MSNLNKEFEYFLANQGKLVSEYGGKVVVIKNGAVIGVYDDQLKAVTETRKHHQMGTFLVQKVESGKDVYTQTFHSRVAFP